MLGMMNYDDLVLLSLKTILLNRNFALPLQS
jgi:hypothetical protein